MTATIFLAFVVTMAAVVVSLCARYLNGRIAAGLLTGLSGWFLYAGLLGCFGVLRNTAMRLPGAAFLFVPVVVFLGVFIMWVRSSAGARLALAFPLWILLGTQTFRVGVELFLHQLWLGGLVPKTLTFAGANVDIYTGASAPLVAWWSSRGRLGPGLAYVWNVLGLLAFGSSGLRGFRGTLHAGARWTRAGRTGGFQLPDRKLRRFPNGVPGRELAQLSYLQALKFGAEFVAPCHADKLQRGEDGLYRLRTREGDVATGRTVIVATGVSYRLLNVIGLSDLKGSGVYYNATAVEALLCKSCPVHVIGAGNSAGQAAMFRSQYARQVTLVVRGSDLRKSM